MSFSVSNLAAYESVKQRALDAKWRIGAGHFEDDAKPGLVDFPQGAACIIPDERRWQVAGMQAELRKMVERSVRFADGTTFARYQEGMRGYRVWKLETEMPRSPKLRMGDKRMYGELDRLMEGAELSERTRLWFRTLYGTLLGHTRNLAERGRSLAGRTDWMFGEITGQSPGGRIRAMFTPVSIHFRCEKKQDCARLIFPNPIHEERRGEAEGWRGAQVVHKLPPSLGAFKVPVSVENYEVTRGDDAFGTFEHEQDHALNNYFIDRDTLLGAVTQDETGLQSCTRAALAGPVKEELLAWSLRPKTAFKGLFLGKGASYDPVQKAMRRLRERKVAESEVQEFGPAATRYLEALVPPAANTLDRLLERYAHPDVREVLRTLPVHRWADMESTLHRHHHES